MDLERIGDPSDSWVPTPQVCDVCVHVRCRGALFACDVCVRACAHLSDIGDEEVARLNSALHCCGHMEKE